MRAGKTSARGRARIGDDRGDEENVDRRAPPANAHSID